VTEERFEARVEGVVPASVEKVWEAFATGEGFSKIYEGITVEGDWRVGGTVVWSGEWEGKAFRDEGVVIAYDQPRRFDYTYWTSFWNLPQTRENTQTISNVFEAVTGGTRVMITQTNIPSAQSRDHSVKNWGDILNRVVERLR